MEQTDKIEVSQALEPCPNPWCESHQFNAVPELPGDLWTIDGSNAVRIGCPSCAMLGPHRTTEAEAIAAWNTRPNTPDEVKADRNAGLEAATQRYRAILARIDEQVSHALMGDWHIALTNIRSIVREVTALRTEPPAQEGE